MGFQYENRLGQVYYLQEGKTPKGKPKYYMGKKLTGAPVDALPEGYEIHESPERGLVVVRKIQPSAITEDERESVVQAVRRASGLEYFKVEIEGESLVVWTSGMDVSEADDTILHLAGRVSPARADELRDLLFRKSRYMKMLRFVLVDPERREFRVERWCFRGSIDDWIPIGGRGRLAELAEGLASHLGRQSFYDLM